MERLRHLDAVARTLHFGMAAAQLGIDQSILSRSIKRLEEEVGAPLLDRSRGHVALTPSGQVFLDGSRKALEVTERAGRLARLAAAKQDVDLRLGVPQSRIVTFVPKAIRMFQSEHPQLTVRLVDDLAKQLEALREGDIDLVLGLRSKNNRRGLERFSVQLLRRYSLLAAAPSSWPVARKTQIRLADLAEYPFVLAPSASRVAAERLAAVAMACREAGFTPKVVQESWQLDMTMGLVAQGVGVTLVIESTALLMQVPGVTYLPVVDLPDSLLIDALAVFDDRVQNRSVGLFLRQLEQAANAEVAGARASDDQPPWSPVASALQGV
jgi:DNA-binding transcriptional LysR family regulator